MHVNTRSGWIMIMLATVTVTGCQTPMIQRAVGLRNLTDLEMDKVAAGSVTALSDAVARAVGTAPDSNVIGIASANSGNGPVVGMPIFYFANSQMVAAASGESAQTSLSSGALVENLNRKTELEARAFSNGMTEAQSTTHIYGVSTAPADVVFGSAAAIGCCGTHAKAQVSIFSKSAGPYSTQLADVLRSDAFGAITTKVDIAVVSSTLPMLPPAQVLVAGVRTSVSPKY